MLAVVVEAALETAEAEMVEERARVVVEMVVVLVESVAVAAWVAWALERQEPPQAQALVWVVAAAVVAMLMAVRSITKIHL